MRAGGHRGMNNVLRSGTPEPCERTFIIEHYICGRSRGQDNSIVGYSSFLGLVHTEQKRMRSEKDKKINGKHQRKFSFRVYIRLVCTLV